jgi:hypothetical protein
VTCFSGGEAPDFQPRSGRWAFSAGYDPDAPCDPLAVLPRGTYTTDATPAWSLRNVSVWTGGSGTVYREAECGLLLRPGPLGSRHNAGLAVNYRDPEGSHLYLSLDYESQSFRLERVTGGAPARLAEVPLPFVFALLRYRLTAKLLPGPTPGSVLLHVRVRAADAPSGYATFDSALGPFLLTGYGDNSGRFGVETDRSVADFTYFRVAEAS